jgi:hypothetical protein
MKTKFITTCIAGLFIVCSSFVNLASASLITIDFESLSTGAFTQGEENGFNITAQGTDTKIIDPKLGTGNTAFSDGGSQVPSDWFFSTNSSFIFEQFDMGSFYNQGDHVLVTGWLGSALKGVDKYTTTTSKWNSQLSTEFAKSLEGVEIDKILITMVSTSQLHGVIDNVVMKKMPSVVPEPSTLAIFALGIIGLTSRRFKDQVLGTQ